MTAVEFTSCTPAVVVCATPSRKVCPFSAIDRACEEIREKIVRAGLYWLGWSGMGGSVQAAAAAPGG